MFLYDFATKTAQKPDTVATYIRRNEKIFKNHVERKEKQLWLDEKAVKILLKKYPEVQRKKYPWKNDTEFQEAMLSAIKGLWDNQEILQKELDGILTVIEELQDAMDHTEPQKENNGLISLEELFGEDEDTQVDKLKRQVKEQGEKIELLQREISLCRTKKSLSSASKDVSTCENNKRHVGDSYKPRKHEGLQSFPVTFFRKKASNLFVRQTTNRACWDTPKP